MSEQVAIIRVFMASPGHVKAERDVVPRILDELNRGILRERNLREVRAPGGIWAAHHFVGRQKARAGPSLRNSGPQE
jgi:hypothetical protein